jgi:FlaA1/EpsC-like NDP-sugar epimerase
LLHPFPYNETLRSKVIEISLSNTLLKEQGIGKRRRNLFLRLRRHWLYSMQTVLDLSVLASAFAFSYLLRFDFDIPRNEVSNFFVQAPLVVLVQFVALSVSGARGGIWRYTGMGHIKSFLYAALASLVAMTLLRLELPSAYQAWRVPLSVNVIDSMLAFGGVFGLRILRREVYEHTKRRRQTNNNGNVKGIEKLKKLVLLIGAGQAGALAANEIDGRGDLDLDIVGFIDDDRMKLGRSVGQKHRVLGTTEDLRRLVRSLGIDHVVITMAQASRQEIHRIVKICEQIPIKVRIIPGLYEILDGRVGISRIRDVQIADLLGRESVQLDVESISKALAGRTVMVTGAGGSIGSELARQVQRFAPANLLLVDRAEFALFDVDLELRHSSIGPAVVPLVGDVGDENRMRGIFETYRPQVVIHAAAHKHVPLMELNPIEAVKNNVMNSRLLAELAGEFGAEVFVLVSTDKAVRPESIMGASKRAAELVIQDLKNRYATRYVAVRFGNVIGSAGSVIPIFRKQISNGGPVTITDRRMKRYFMTIPEAAQLVLQTSTLAKGGEVFILHMGEPVRIMDLAETLITLSGLKPHDDIKIVETGIRPGEKLYEELSFDSEETVPTSHPKIFIHKLATLETETVREALLRLSELIRYGDAPQLRTFLNDLIPEAHLNGNALEAGARAFGAATAVGRVM